MRFPAAIPGTRTVLAPLVAVAALAGPLVAQDGASAGELPAGARNPAPSADTVDPSLFGGLSFRFVGPSRGGRVTAVEGHRSHPHTFYQGATGGGV
ncbi:MAG: hypothetical protein F4143_05275 [Gemmatimonadales bacterium]|nr:hypothetical protein [Gemmatimonadales bacterium]